MQLQLREQRQGGVVILAPEGRLDSGKIDQFDKTLQARIREGHHRVLVDCTNLIFAASSALRVLLIAVRKLNEVDGKLVLCNMNPHVQGIFDTCGFTRLMTIRGTFDEGFAELQPPGAGAAEDEPEPAEGDPQTRPREEEPAPEATPASPREGIVKQTVLAPFRLITAIGRFLIR